MTPKEALDILIEGNQRFIGNIASNKDLQQLVHLTKDKQHPFAAVLSCSDSRAPVEMLFDQALGDIFSVRLAQRNSENKDFVSKVAKLNVEMQMNSILRDSEILQSMIAKHEVGLIGGMYDLSSGKVEFYKDTAHL